MKKIRWATHKNLFKQIATSSCMLAVSAGLVFGVSAGTFKVNYFDLNNEDVRLNAANNFNYYSQRAASQWNMFEKLDKDGKVVVDGYDQPTSPDLKSDTVWWKKTFGNMPKWCEPDKGVDPSKMELNKPIPEEISETAQKERTKYGSLIIDGAQHTNLDRSFNQSLFQGIDNFILNRPHVLDPTPLTICYKPSQDTTQEFINIYRKASELTRTLCLAGFAHVSSLNALGKVVDGKYKFDDPTIARTALLLIDGDIPNNQNMASVLFRSDQGAFLSALATCMYLYNNLEVYHNHFQDLSVGAYGGNPLPTVTVYMGGFQRGLEFFNNFILKETLLNGHADDYMNGIDVDKDSHFINHLLPASKYKDEIEKIRAKKGEKEDEINEMNKKLYDEYSIKMIKLGAFGTHFTGSFSSGDAIGISKQFLNRGASVILPVAATQVLDSAQEVMNQNGSAIVIGVDCPMEDSDFQKPFTKAEFKDRTVDGTGKHAQNADKIIKFSAVKDMTSVSEKILRLGAEGKHWDVNIESPWQSQTPIPTSAQDKPVDINKLDIEYVESSKRFNVLGFKQTQVEGNALFIPTSITKGKDTYLLNLIGQEGAGRTPEIPFTFFNLKNIETFKIIGKPAPNQKVKLAKEAFPFKSTETSGFTYIDLSAIPVQDMVIAGTQPFGEIGLNPGSKCRQKGVIKFGHADIEKENQDLWINLGISQEDWAKVEPDPQKSVCGYGFKTCGNIENGLTSISKDGWPLLIQALQYLKGIQYPTPLTPSYSTFMEIWETMATEYCATHGLADTDFAKAVITKDWKKLFTYDKENPLYVDYPHTMSIIGLVLKKSILPFSKDMTLVLDDAGQPQKLPSDVKTINLSILDWLKYNMYFIV